MSNTTNQPHLTAFAIDLLKGLHAIERRCAASGVRPEFNGYYTRRNCSEKGGKSHAI